MSERASIEAILVQLGIESPVRSICDLSGGCIHRVSRVELAGGRALIVKSNAGEFLDAFEEEAAGLDRLGRTRTVLTPTVLGVVGSGSISAIVMEALTPGPACDEAWWGFGRDLAALHDAPAGDRYGFEHDNHLGSTPQPNGWMEDWVAFNAERRLGHQLRLAHDRNLLHADEASRVEKVIDRLDRYIPRSPKPALLHGDLWSGNAMACADGRGGSRIAVIDPACSIGDGWADIAMMRLFGGFPDSCHAAYEEAVSDRDQVESRIAVYQLYHVLNHVNIFGRGYIGQAMSLVRSLGE